LLAYERLRRERVAQVSAARTRTGAATTFVSNGKASEFNGGSNRLTSHRFVTRKSRLGIRLNMARPSYLGRREGGRYH
jgi:hypothetical protein